eukprot:1937481-Amphidinium_carterae.1
MRFRPPVTVASKVALHVESNMACKIVVCLPVKMAAQQFNTSSAKSYAVFDRSTSFLQFP